MCRRHTVCVNAFGVDKPQTRFASLNDHLGFAQMVICAFRSGDSMTLRGCRLRPGPSAHNL